MQKRMQGLPQTHHGDQKHLNAADQLKLQHQEENARREKAQVRSAKVDLRNPPTPEMKERRKRSTAKTSALKDVLYAEIHTSAIYIYDPLCRRCCDIMARTCRKAGKKKDNRSINLSYVEKRKPQTYKLKKMRSDCYVGKRRREACLENQTLNITSGSSDINVIVPINDSKDGGSSSYPDTSKSSFRSTSSMESNQQPMI